MRTEGGFWCTTCKKYYGRDANQCDKCVPILWNDYTPPTKYESIFRDHENKKEDKKMIVTIIGSLSKKEEMKRIKEHFERFGHKVNVPYDPEIQEMALLSIQSLWIKKIREADLVVALAKNTALESDGGQHVTLEFGESTSYEMAIALDMKKEIVMM